MTDRLKIDNIIQALDYLIASECDHFAECEANGEDVEKHIFNIAKRAKADVYKYCKQYWDEGATT